MSNGDIVRAWKDAEYRQSLSAEEQALLPEHPAGAIELTDEALEAANGGEILAITDSQDPCPPTYFNTCYSACLTNYYCC